MKLCDACNDDPATVGDLCARCVDELQCTGCGAMSDVDWCAPWCPAAAAGADEETPL